MQDPIELKSQYMPASHENAGHSQSLLKTINHGIGNCNITSMAMLATAAVLQCSG